MLPGFLCWQKQEDVLTCAVWKCYKMKGWRNEGTCSNVMLLKFYYLCCCSHYCLSVFAYTSPELLNVCFPIWWTTLVNWNLCLFTQSANFQSRPSMDFEDFSLSHVHYSTGKFLFFPYPSLLSAWGKSIRSATALFTLGFKNMSWLIGSQVHSKATSTFTPVSIVHLQGVHATLCFTINPRIWVHSISCIRHVDCWMDYTEYIFLFHSIPFRLLRICACRLRDLLMCERSDLTSTQV